jgi:PhnB protein
MKLRTYVNFAGTCLEAFRYYEKHLGGKIEMMMTHGQSPAPSRLGPEWKDAVLHGRISIGGTELMAADIPSAQPMRSAYLTPVWTAMPKPNAYSPRLPRVARF